MARPLVAPAMAAVVRRLSASDRRDRYVLRGGLVTAALVAPRPRPVDDVDLLARVDAFDGNALVADLRAILATDVGDGVAIGDPSTEVIWEETAFPGIRARVVVGDAPLQIDIGFGDPLCGGPVERAVVDGAPVLACRAETMLGWKLHGMFERGDGRWRAKDLHDLDLLLGIALDEPLVRPSIELAFSSRGDELSLVTRLLTGPFGESRSSRRKWRLFREARAGVVDVGELPDVVARVGARLRRYIQLSPDEQ